MIEHSNEVAPEVAGVLMAVLMAVLRIVYDHKETRPLRILIEALLCGALSLTASSGIKAFGMGIDWAIFAGGCIGYFGPLTVRAIALRAIKNKTK